MRLNFWQSGSASLTKSQAPKSQARAAHMTFARSGLGRTFSQTRHVLKRQLWLWPLLAILVLSSVGYSVHRAIESTMKESLRSQLQTLLTVETEMLNNWYGVQISHAQAVANTPSIRKSVAELVSERLTGQSRSLEEQRQTKLTIQREMSPFLDAHGHEGFLIADRSHRIIAASDEESVGLQNVQQYSNFLARVYDGATVVSTPVASVSIIKDDQGNMRTGTPTMFAAAPVRDENFQVIGALALRIQPEKEFTRILQLGQMGSSGETYAFDRTGTLVSNSRFDHDLILTGLLPDQPNSKSILSLLLRAPGGDMTRGYRPTIRRSEMPLTKMAASATAGKSDVDVDGYSDYRGVLVVGAWTWLPEFEIGLATEIDMEEAYRPLTILSRVFWALYLLLVTASIAIFAFTLVVNRMQRAARKAAIEAQELGQYKLEQKLGAGAMGVVYKGYHAMMRRPTAIKLLNVDVMTDSAIARFEHEVQITSQLNHPNTIAIYDYGRTPEGVFYYAMEYLDGIDLQVLVDQYGPQPEARVIQIMLQICGSLYEAHAQGLVHRDIKPANLMLNRRGGQPDVVKVLDFGLVKQVDAAADEHGLAGTPLYMSPEAIQSPNLVDACSDLYALGAVGYFLLTGKSVFDASTIVELLQKHVTESPLPPSQRVHVSVSPEFEDVLLSCLEKSRSRRPQTARDLAQMLLRCPTAGMWTVLDAEAWWSNHDRRQRGSSGGAATLLAATGHTLASGPVTTARGATQHNTLSNPGSTASNRNATPPQSSSIPATPSAGGSDSAQSAPPRNPSAGNVTRSAALDQTLWHGDDTKQG